MNFKAFYESKTKIGLYGWCEISDISDAGLFDESVVKVWNIIRHFRDGGEVHYVLTLDKGGEYQMYDSEGNDIMPSQFDQSEYIEAVKQWEIKHNLTPQTKETFGDLVDEL